MAKHHAGTPFTSAQMTCRPTRRARTITGYVIRVIPVPPPKSDIPMSKIEATNICNALIPGALHKLHLRRVSDPIAIRALEVLRII